MYGDAQYMSLQDRQKIPKWNCPLHLGQFLDFSDLHYSIVANVCHLSTGYVSLHYHLAFDDLFETVFSTGNDALLDDICNYFFDSDCNFYFYDDEITSNDPLVYHPPPLCQSCQLACSKRRVPKVNQPMKAPQDQEGALS